MHWLLLLISLPLAFGCVTAIDCNGKECADCICRDSECVCADGWGGVNCTIPFCSRRSDCSNHGDCIATLKNISCVCDPGWQGDRCDTKSCPLNCTHGGVPDSGCTQCVGCLGAWYGKQCENWNASVSLNTLLAGLSDIAGQSQAALDSLAPLRPLCSQSQECLGWGIDLSYGGVASMPVLQLSYTDATKMWAGYREPVEATVAFSENPQFDFQTGSGVYPLISDFTNAVGARLGAGIGLNGIYSQAWNDVFDSHYQQSGDFSMTVVQGQMWLYQMTLAADTPMLDKFAARAIASLPPDYNTATNQAMYQHFIKNWGTSVVTKSYSGGVVAQYSDWKSSLLDKPYSFDETWLMNNAQIDYTSTVGIGGHSGTVNPTYAINRQNRTLCLGGNPASCLDVSSWKASLIQNPILVQYEATPLAQFISDPATKANVQQALHAYIVQQNAQWDALNKCPITCNNRGSCSPPSLECDCTFYGGRMCSNPTISTEYTLTDKGPGSMSMMPLQNGFCFITNGHGWYNSDEHCQIASDGNNWVLNKNSGQGYLECGARCVSSPSWNMNQITEEYFLKGQGNSATQMIPTTKGFCFLVEGASFYEGGESCVIAPNATTGSWILTKTSGQGGFICGARCVYSTVATAQVSKEFAFSGKGSYSTALVSAQDGICFITHARSWYENGEHCWLTVDQNTWTLHATSGQSDFVCGARCTVQGSFANLHL